MKSQHLVFFDRELFMKNKKNKLIVNKKKDNNTSNFKAPGKKKET